MAYDKERREQYLAKLRDPRWQKLRLQVFERDEFTCKFCFDNTRTLHVHHLYYVADREPWNYPLEAFLTLCETCHEEETANLPAAAKHLVDCLKAAGVNAGHMTELADSIVRGDHEPPMHDPLISAIAKLLRERSWQHELLDKYFESLKKKTTAQIAELESK